ncbi:MAG: enoyl-CoA hydratase/isomerase family protein, partial [Solirubrobacteraceae bacterium]|nr:enoyl-CoA hydratase/isomerase family protein [Patulibacter sp.]
MTNASPLSITRDGAVATLTFHAPPLNLLDAVMTDALDGAIAELEAEPPRALLLRAEGRAWTGGVDVEQFSGLSGQQGHDLWVRLLGFTQRIEGLPCPSVFSAHALCLTWGLELALGCDLLIASPKAKFGLVEKVVGLTPSMGGTQRLAARAGNARAKAFVMSAGLYGAEELHTWGVVTHLVPEDELEDAARALVQELADGPTVAHNATRAILAAQASGGVAAADAIVPQVCGDLFETEDLKAAVRSFLDVGPG